METDRAKRNKGRRQLLFVMALFLIPPVAAWLVWQYMQANGVVTTSNAGTLINPARPLPENALTPLGTTDLVALKGRWHYVIFADQVCSEACQEQLHLTRQVRLRTNKDIQRVRRLLVLNNVAESDALLTMLAEQHQDLVVAQVADQATGEGWKAEFSGAGFASDGNQFFLIDPLGNLMMHYSLNTGPQQLLKDLKKLLKASQIG